MIVRLLGDEAATLQAGNDFAAALRRGDVLALHGDLGAGKTTLARAIIRSLAGEPRLDVPSPTFTLVQLYEGRLPVAHFDLYRIGDPEEVAELGLDEAARDGVALIEWPDKASLYLSDTTIHVKLLEEEQGRSLTIDGPADRIARIERAFAIRDFLDRADRAGAVRGYLAGDASARSYETIDSDAGRELLMNAPRQPDGPPIRDGKPYSRIAHLAESVHAFVAVATALRARGFAAPEIRGTDLGAGFLLLEDLGREGVLDENGTPIGARYRGAAEALAAIHRHEWSGAIRFCDETYGLPVYDHAAMAIETGLLIDWYLPYAAGRAATVDERTAFVSCWEKLFERLDRAEKSIVLRDYHSPNIIWRSEAEGTDRIGIIDFQDAVIGPSAYDVASLAMDARVTICEELEAGIRDAYVASRDGNAFDREDFEEAYAIMAAQRNSKVLGIFVRLNERDGKPQYLKHLPRIRDYLERATRHPALAELRDLYRRMHVLPDGAK